MVAMIAARAPSHSTFASALAFTGCRIAFRIGPENGPIKLQYMRNFHNAAGPKH